MADTTANDTYHASLALARASFRVQYALSHPKSSKEEEQAAWNASDKKALRSVARKTLVQLEKRGVQLLVTPRAEAA